MNRRELIKSSIAGLVLASMPSMTTAQTRRERRKSGEAHVEFPEASMFWKKDVDRHELDKWNINITVFSTHEEAREATKAAANNVDPRMQTLNSSESFRSSKNGDYPIWARSTFGTWVDGLISYRIIAVVENTLYEASVVGSYKGCNQFFSTLKDIWNTADHVRNNDDLRALLPTEKDIEELEPYI